mmetsp:Transcript_15708/g.18929  ORF Transcript_15708/g.18929 Transcript_15708/m.18929 type:complete len:813 (+) Transcript_15708:199-2637(+)|eukprot:CAMPEP_0197843770 /NCGR_PEP_ID=MMETSP1438-20131217/696_1 /TAXON_ID=1461541 /ORGANISM="Pterosperma sp., Strain CCMP1384" /LENGTH=812 /DNA_ID=CAMNT_0043454137 /DNA_START=186 /DNA_END=2624 /DNA_ORIENTATION=-
MSKPAGSNAPHKPVRETHFLLSKMDTALNLRVDQVSANLNQITKIIFAVVCCLSLFVVGTFIINVFAMEYTKDAKPNNDGVMKVVGSDEVMKVGSADFHVEADSLTGEDGNSIRVAQDIQDAQLTSTLPNSAFDELRVFKTVGSNGATLSLNVIGWSRIPDLASPGGSYVQLVTWNGIIKVQGYSISFTDTMGQLFVEAGFQLDASGRKLLGIYELVGMFNTVTDWELPDGEVQPSWADSDFAMNYTLKKPCSGDPNGCQSFVGIVEPLGEQVPLLNKAGDYALVDYFIQFDSALGMTWEIVRNQEWKNDYVVSYKGQRGVGSAQYHSGGCFYYSHSDKSPEAAGFSLDPAAVTSAKKIGETKVSDFDGTIYVQREFELTMEVDLITYQMITDMDDVTAKANYNGTVTIKYFDDKDTQAPKAFYLPNGVQMIVTGYVKAELDLSKVELPAAEACLAPADSLGVSKLQVDGYGENVRGRLHNRRQVAEAEYMMKKKLAVQKEELATAGRKLLTHEPGTEPHATNNSPSTSVSGTGEMTYPSLEAAIKDQCVFSPEIFCPSDSAIKSTMCTNFGKDYMFWTGYDGGAEGCYTNTDARNKDTWGLWSQASQCVSEKGTTEAPGACLAGKEGTCKGAAKKAVEFDVLGGKFAMNYFTECGLDSMEFKSGSSTFTSYQACSSGSCAAQCTGVSPKTCCSPFVTGWPTAAFSCDGSQVVPLKDLLTGDFAWIQEKFSVPASTMAKATATYYPLDNMVQVDFSIVGSLGSAAGDITGTTYVLLDEPSYKQGCTLNIAGNVLGVPFSGKADFQKSTFTKL